MYTLLLQKMDKLCIMNMISGNCELCVSVVVGIVGFALFYPADRGAKTTEPETMASWRNVYETA